MNEQEGIVRIVVHEERSLGLQSGQNHTTINSTNVGKSSRSNLVELRHFRFGALSFCQHVSMLSTKSFCNYGVWLNDSFLFMGMFGEYVT